MKYCPTCDTTKDLSGFSKASARHDGLQSMCKECRGAKRKASYQKNKEHELAVNKKWAQENPDVVKEKEKRYRQSPHGKIKTQVWNAKWRKENPEKRKDVDKRAGKKWRAANRGTVNANLAKYRASKLQATPPWLSEKDQKQIKRIYTTCSNVSERTGKPHHVDHIVPLQGENVCGLHVPWNLAIIPASMNLSKSNKF